MTTGCSSAAANNQCSSVMSSQDEAADRTSSEAADTVAMVAMSLLTAVAIVGNLVVLVVIVRRPSLRVQLTNFFIINLCIVDLVAATVVMPMSLAGVNTRSSSTNVTTLSTASDVASRSIPCTVFRLLSTFVAFASVLSILLANVERYVSIRHPMQHAAHLTVGRTLAAIVSVWAVAVGVAAMPVAADWYVLDTGAQCCVTGLATSASGASVAFVVVVLTLLFVAPTFVMAAMCCSIYRVARQAGRRVAPGAGDDTARPTQCRPGQGSSSTVSAVSCCIVVQPSMSCPALNNIQRHNSTATKSASVACESSSGSSRHRRAVTTSPLPAVADSPTCIIRVTCHADDAPATDQPGALSTVSVSPVTEARTSTADRRWKAAATLLFVLLTFVLLWSPYFVYSLYRAVERSYQALDCSSSVDHVEQTVVWIGFATFASNAFVYGWMNRAIRDALGEAVDDCSFRRCVKRGRDRLSQVLGAGDAEDFFQFLERTSNFDRAQSLTQSSVQLAAAAANPAQP